MKHVPKYQPRSPPRGGGRSQSTFGTPTLEVPTQGKEAPWVWNKTLTPQNPLSLKGQGESNRRLETKHSHVLVPVFTLKGTGQVAVYQKRSWGGTDVGWNNRLWSPILQNIVRGPPSTEKEIHSLPGPKVQRECHHRPTVDVRTQWFSSEKVKRTRQGSKRMLMGHLRYFFSVIKPDLRGT